MGVTATVLGASGYTGAEVIRLLEAHPAVEVVGVARSGDGGEQVGSVLPHLAGRPGVRFGPASEVAARPVDVCFSCLPSGALEPDRVGAGIVVDLSDDRRADPDWVYGLTEFSRPSLATATRIANPGCYPTATLLALLPFVRAGLVTRPVIVDAMSGVSGAGRKAEDRLLAAHVEGGVAAYGTVEHRHVPEIERGLAAFGRSGFSVSFTPHLVPIARGLLVTARARLETSMTDTSALDVLRSVYEHEPFVHVVEDWPGTKAVRGSNSAHVSARVDARNGWLVCSAAIDNLGKGAAGQAIQNANLALGLEEAAGLPTLGIWP